jgi:beta-xylosidase
VLFRDPSRSLDERVDDLVGRLTLEEKLAQLRGVWLNEPSDHDADSPASEVSPGSEADDVAPLQSELSEVRPWAAVIEHGLGQLTRPYGTAPVAPAAGAREVARRQTEIVAASRLGIPAVVHEEGLTGFMTYGATVYPTPLAWGATFDPALVERMGAQIGTVMRRLGVHQCLAPVLDVSRDPRWGRTEETIGEDPYLVGLVGAAYVRGLESTGIVSTLKHFAGYSGSRSGRNFGPVSAGPHEFADVFLPPFEMAIRLGGARSVMHSYAEVDGVPPAADPRLLTGLLRDTWGFTGTVVSDYYGVTFLESLHHVAGSLAEAAALALTAGVDVELPTLRCYAEPLRDAVTAGTVPEAVVDRAVRRVLRQKLELGLLDGPLTPPEEDVDLDPPESRALARRIAEESVVLLANDGVLPLRADQRVAVVGPLADDVAGLLGCYTFPSHVSRRYDDLPLGVELPTLLAGLRKEHPHIEHVPGCGIDTVDTSGFAAATEAAARADVCVVVLGDRAGLFGRGTSGEGCDVDELKLPGVQAELLEAVLDAVVDTATPVVLVLMSGRPYPLGAAVDRLAGVVQAFFAGEEGGPAVAGVLTGRVEPAGRLPVSVPRTAGAQPTTYLTPHLGRRSDVSSVDPTPLYPFGHGLTYTDFLWTGDETPVTQLPTDGSVTVGVSVRNTGARAGTEVVQLYLHDPVAQVTRPVIRLIGFARVPLGPGEQRRVTFTVPADLTGFTGRTGARIVEPGAIELRLGPSSVDIRHTVPLTLTGPERTLGGDRAMISPVVIEPPTSG